ncbi:MAG TPA: DUF6478 family protein [Paenirhodobacter sp.]
MHKQQAFLARLLTRYGLRQSGPRQMPRKGMANLPWGCDWVWQPDPWCVPMVPQVIAAGVGRAEIAPGVALLHDGAMSDITLTQEHHNAGSGGMALAVGNFDGSFLSLVIDLSGAGLAGLRRNHLLRLATQIRSERPARIYIRLNLTYGGHTEYLVRQHDVLDGDYLVDFDLAVTGMAEQRLEKAWVDVIFAEPQHNRVLLRDLVLLRHPRANI